MGAFADWMANKLEGRARLKAGAFDVPEEERDPLSLNSYWTPAEEAAAASDGGAFDQLMAVISSPITMAKGIWEGAKDAAAFSDQSLKRVPETDAEVREAGPRGLNAVSMAALGSGPMGALTAQGRRAAMPAYSFLDNPGEIPFFGESVQIQPPSSGGRPAFTHDVRDVDLSSPYILGARKKDGTPKTTVMHAQRQEFPDIYKRPDPLSVAQMQGLGKSPPGGAYAVIDDTTRGPVRFLGGDDLSSADIMARMRAERIPASISGEGIGASNYPDLSSDWAAGPGSGRVTQKMLGAFDQATPGTQKALDSWEMRQRARAENMHNRAIANRYGLTTREDLMRMREIYGREGFDGLRAALARGDALPSNADVAGLVALLTQHEEGGEL